MLYQCEGQEYYGSSEPVHKVYEDTLREITLGLRETLGNTARGALEITLRLTLSEAITVLGAVAASACGARLTMPMLDEVDDVLGVLSSEILQGAISATTQAECSTWNIDKGAN